MRIDSPKMTNAEVTGSFKGSFSGSFEGDIQADSVAYANVTGKPNGLISGSATDARAQLGVVIGTDVQAYADNLNEIAGLNPADSNFIVGNGSTFIVESGATARTSLGLGSFATINSLSYSELTNIPDGVVSSSAQIDELFNVDGLVSGSSISSANQGEVALTLNGVEASAIDLGVQTTDSPTFAGLTVNGAITVTGNVDGRDVSADGTKLDGIESGATADQTATEIKSAYESNANTNAYTDAEVTKLAGIEANATGDQTAAEILTALKTVDGSGSGLDADLLDGQSSAYYATATAVSANTTKLAGIEANATGDQSAAEILAAVKTVDGSGSGLDADLLDGQSSTYYATATAVSANTTKLAGIESGATGDQTGAEIKALYEAQSDTNAFDDAAVTKLAGIAAGATNNTAELSTLSDRVTDVEGDVSAILTGAAADKDSFAEIVTLINSVDTTNDTAFGTHVANTSNPHSVTKAQVGLGSVDNTSDAAKPISTATQTALDTKQAAGTYNTIIGTDTDVAYTGATVLSTVTLTDGVVQGHTSRTLTLADLGYTGVTNANNYSHPTFAGDDITVDTGALTGAVVISDLDFNVTTDTNGHVTDANGTVATRTLTLADLGYTGVTNANYITNNNQITNGAGYITGVTNISGNAGTATKLQTARTIAGVSFDGSANITLSNSNITNGAGYTTYSSNQATDNSSNVHFEGLMVGQTTGATANTIRCVGDIVAYYSSDQQFKDNIVTLEGALDKVKAIRGVRFDWNDKQDVYEGHDIGVVAQEVEAVLPELVHYREHNDSKAVDYVKLTAVLIEAVKELAAKVEVLENR
jgi:hypothetical protein